MLDQYGPCPEHRMSVSDEVEGAAHSEPGRGNVWGEAQVANFPAAQGL